MAAFDHQHQVAAGTEIGGRKVHVETEAAGQHPARFAHPVGPVEREADRQRVQQDAPLPSRAAVTGGERAGDVVVGDASLDIDFGGEALATDSPGRDRRHDGIDLDLGRALGEINGVAHRCLGSGQIDHRPTLDPVRDRVAEAEHLDRMTASAQRFTLRVGTQLRDQAGDLAGADVERHDQRGAPRRDRFHLRGEAVIERAHAAPPLRAFARSLMALSRACAAASESRTVTRSGSRRSIAATSRVMSFLS